MKMKLWTLLVMVAVMVLGMLGLMVLLSIVIGSSNMLLMTYGDEGVGTWRLMLVPFMGLLIMAGLMFLVFRWLTSKNGPLPLMKGKPEAANVIPEAKYLTTLSFKLPDLSCEGCKLTVEEKLGTLPGVHSVSVDLAAQTAVVTLITPPTREEIIALLKELGYPPTKG